MVYSPQKSPKSQHATHPCQPCPRKQSFDPLGDFRHTIRDPFKLTRESCVGTGLIKSVALMECHGSGGLGKFLG